MTKKTEDVKKVLDIEEKIELTSLIPNGLLSKDPDQQQHPINSSLVIFLRNIRSIQVTRSVALPHILSWLKSQHEGNSKKLAKYATESEDGKNIFEAKSAHQASDMLRAIRDLDNLGGMRIPETIQRSLFTQLFSEYDSFIGSLLKSIYAKRIDLLKSISRQVSFAELLEYENLNAIQHDMLEKEVETFRRNSYVDQFSNLESKFAIKLKEFTEWGEFIELSQRRNLIVHNNGIVSDQYLVVCDREGYKFNERPRAGDALKLDGKYFNRAITVVSKVAFMLCHTLWRKLLPDEIEISHNEANSAIFNLLADKQWNTANAIAKFTLSSPMKSKISDMDLRIRTINAAIATKFSGAEEECKSIVNSLDWSAALRDFKLAISILSDNFSMAADLMILIGKRGEIVQELSYHDWPLFHKFRESPEFLNAYAEVYGTSFISESIRHSTEAAEASQFALDKEGDTVSAKASSKTEKQKKLKVQALKKNVNSKTSDIATEVKPKKN